MRKTKTIIALMAISMVLFSCGNKSGEKKSNQSDSTTVEKKSDPNEVKIGDQTWTVKNLEVTTFSNGDPIPEATSKAEWKAFGEKKQPAWCYPEYNKENGKKYGKLYNWFAAVSPKGLAPKGWHIPSDEEWYPMINFLGGENIAGVKLKSSTQWNGNNTSGFNALPSGRCGFWGEPEGVNSCTEYWTTTKGENRLDAWNRGLTTDSIIHRYSSNKVNGLAIRCIKD